MYFFKKRNKKCNTIYLKTPEVGPYMLYTTRNAIVSSLKKTIVVTGRSCGFFVIFETLFNLEGDFILQMDEKEKLF